MKAARRMEGRDWMPTQSMRAAWQAVLDRHAARRSPEREKARREAATRSRRKSGTEEPLIGEVGKGPKNLS